MRTKHLHVAWQTKLWCYKIFKVVKIFIESFVTLNPWDYSFFGPRAVPGRIHEFIVVSHSPVRQFFLTISIIKLAQNSKKLLRTYFLEKFWSFPKWVKSTQNVLKIGFFLIFKKFVPFFFIFTLQWKFIWKNFGSWVICQNSLGHSDCRIY